MSSEGRGSKPLDEALTGLANWWFKLVVVGFVSFLAGVTVLIWTMVGSGTIGPTTYIFLVFAAIISLLALIWLDGVRRRAPCRIQEFLLRMGLYRQR